MPSCNHPIGTDRIDKLRQHGLDEDILKELELVIEQAREDHGPDPWAGNNPIAYPLMESAVTHRVYAFFIAHDLDPTMCPEATWACPECGSFIRYCDNLSGCRFCAHQNQDFN